MDSQVDKVYSLKGFKGLTKVISFTGFIRLTKTVSSIAFKELPFSFFFQNWRHKYSLHNYVSFIVNEGYKTVELTNCANENGTKSIFRESVNKTGLSYS